MEKKFILIIIIWGSLVKTYGQWDSLPVKTKLVYSFSRGKTVTNYSGSKEDVNKLYFKNNITITIDTVVYLKEKNRKLIFFSRSLNDIVINEVSQIFDSIIKRPNDYEKINKIIGNPIFDEEDFSIASKQATAVYQYNNAIYFLTIPKTFFLKLRKDVHLVEKIDDALLKSMYDSTKYSKYYADVFIHFENKNYPLKMIVYPKVKPNNQLIPDNEDVGGFLYNYETNAQRLPFEEDSAKLVKKNSFMKNAHKYVERTNKEEPLKTFYLSLKYGIVHSYSYAYDSEHRIHYVNILDLIKVIYP